MSIYVLRTVASFVLLHLAALESIQKQFRVPSSSALDMRTEYIQKCMKLIKRALPLIEYPPPLFEHMFARLHATYCSFGIFDN